MYRTHLPVRPENSDSCSIVGIRDGSLAQDSLSAFMENVRRLRSAHNIYVSGSVAGGVWPEEPLVPAEVTDDCIDVADESEKWEDRVKNSAECNMLNAIIARCCYFLSLQDTSAQVLSPHQKT